MKKLIKIYGERNTSTNYLSQLIKLNLQATEVSGVAPKHILKVQKIVPGNELIRDIYFYLTYRKNLGWKHSCVKPNKIQKKYKQADSQLSFITITKNPYSWLLSLHRKPYHHSLTKKQSFKQFLQHPWKTVRRDNLKSNLKNPIELWNLKNRSYLQIDNTVALHLLSENIIEQPDIIINKISTHFSIERSSDTFINYNKSTKDMKKDSDYYRNYYRNKKWRDEISSEEIAIINETLDFKLMSRYGYDVIT